MFSSFSLSVRPRELLLLLLLILLLLQMMMDARKTERQLFIDERSRLFFSRACMMKWESQEL